MATSTIEKLLIVTEQTASVTVGADAHAGATVSKPFNEADAPSSSDYNFVGASVVLNHDVGFASYNQDGGYVWVYNRHSASQTFSVKLNKFYLHK